MTKPNTIIHNFCRMIPVDSSNRRAELLRAIAHPNRVRILEAIRRKHVCSCEIGPELNLEQSNLSRHIKLLVHSGILVPERDGVRINYRIADKRIYEILELAGKIMRASTDRVTEDMKA